MRFGAYFDRIFIVNLPDRADRRREMHDELGRVGWQLESGKVEFFPAIRATEAAGFRTPGVHGCFRSHLELLKSARAQGLRRVLVLEDDASFVERFPSDEEEIVSQLSQTDWGMAYIGHALDLWSDRTAILRPYAGPIMLTHCYAVNAPIVDRLVPYLEAILTRQAGDPLGGPMDIDGAYSRFRAAHADLMTLVASPNMCTQRNSRSDVTPRWFDRVPGLSRMAALYRAGKRKMKNPRVSKISVS